jgi:hypothetical protein
MLTIYIHPSYKGISIRTVALPRDEGDLIDIHAKSDYGPLSPMQPTPTTIETFYRRFLNWSSYGAYLLSYGGTTLFLLELMPIDHTELGNFYDAAVFDFSIEIKLGIGPERAEQAVQALLASVEGIFEENPAIYRLVFRVTYSEKGSLLRNILERAGFMKLEEPLDMEEMVIYVKWR